MKKMKLKLKGPVVGLTMLLSILGIGVIQAGEVEVEGSKTLDDGKSKETLQGTYDTTQGIVVKSVQQDIQGGISNEQINSIIDTACSFRNIQCFKGDFNGDGKTDYVQVNKDTGETKYYEYEEGSSKIFKEVWRKTFSEFEPERVSSHSYEKVKIDLVGYSKEILGLEGKKGLLLMLDNQNSYLSHSKKGLYFLDMSSKSLKNYNNILLGLTHPPEETISLSKYYLKDINKYVFSSYVDSYKSDYILNRFFSLKNVITSKILDRPHTRRGELNYRVRAHPLYIGENGNFVINKFEAKLYYYVGNGEFQTFNILNNGEKFQEYSNNTHSNTDKIANYHEIKRIENNDVIIHVIGEHYNVSNGKYLTTKNKIILVIVEDKHTSRIISVRKYNPGIANSIHDRLFDWELIGNIGYAGENNNEFIFTYTDVGSSLLDGKNYEFSINKKNYELSVRYLGTVATYYCDDIANPEPNVSYNYIIDDNHFLYCSPLSKNTGQYNSSNACYLYKIGTDKHLYKLADFTSIGNELLSINQNRGSTYEDISLSLGDNVLLTKNYLESEKGEIQRNYMSKIVEHNGKKYLILSKIVHHYDKGLGQAVLAIYNLTDEKLVSMSTVKEQGDDTWSRDPLWGKTVYIDGDMLEGKKKAVEDISYTRERYKLKKVGNKYYLYGGRNLYENKDDFIAMRCYFAVDNVPSSSRNNFWLEGLYRYGDRAGEKRVQFKKINGLTNPLYRVITPFFDHDKPFFEENSIVYRDYGEYTTKPLKINASKSYIEYQYGHKLVYNWLK